MRRPLMPTMSEIADTSLMLASSRVFWIRWRCLRELAGQLCSRSCQVAQLLDRGWRHKARPDQTVRQKVGDPHRVVDVTLAAGNIAGM